MKCSKRAEILKLFMSRYDVTGKALVIQSAFSGNTVVYVCTYCLSQNML